MKIQLVGVGAAGNKAAICAIEAGVLDSEVTMLINSTYKDVPEDYRDALLITLSDSAYGCAKEREAGRRLAEEAITSGRIKFEEWINPDTDAVVLVSSTDGGTGSGALPELARYIYNQLRVRVHIIALNGFEDDATGLKNTVAFYQELDNKYTYQMICNTKFLKEANNNKLKAQELANKEFCNRLMTLQGSFIIESENNVDDADLFKTVVTPGFMDICYAELSERIRNIEDFNIFINKMCDESKSFDILEQTQKRMAVIVNLNTTSDDAIDWTFSVLRERYGHVKELFTHLQHNEETEFIAFISSGMNFPEHTLEQIYKTYTEENKKTKRKQDTFFSMSKDKFNLDDDEDEDIMYKPQPKVATSKSMYSANKKAEEKEKNFKKKDVIQEY